MGAEVAQTSLHGDLAVRMIEREDGSCDIVHPLVFMFRYESHQACRANELLAFKRHKVEEAVREGDGHRVLTLHERPFRFQALCAYGHLFSDDQEYWSQLRNTWVETELPHQDAEDWLAAWTDLRPGREHAMTAAERTVLAAMPETIVVYRGSNTRRTTISGISWTTDPSKAAWFARRFNFTHGHHPHLASGWVERSAVLAYIAPEREIVVDPRQLRSVTVNRIARRAAR